MTWVIQPGDIGEAKAKLIVGTESIRTGTLTRRELRRSHDQLFRNVYVRRGVELTAVDNAVAAWLWAGRNAVVAGMSAAALLGSKWIPAEAPADLIRPQQHCPPGIVVHKESLAAGETMVLAGLRCTTVPRTIFDLGRWLDFEDALTRIDALLHATRWPLTEIGAIAERHPHVRNLRRLRRLLEIADAGAESPQESVLRLALIDAGLPPVDTQVPVHNDEGRIVRRVDLGWPEWKVGVEYDGKQHWDDARAHASDIGRLEFLASKGWLIVRVSAWHLKNDRPGVIRRVEQALRAAGHPGYANA